MPRRILLLFVLLVSALAPGHVVGQLLQPACENPLPFESTTRCFAGYIVVFVHGTDALSGSVILEQRYGVRALGFLESPVTQALLAELSPEQIAALRCEPLVRRIEHNLILSHGAGVACTGAAIPTLSMLPKVALILVAAAIGAVVLGRS